MQSDFSELIINDSIGNAPTRWDFSELILNDSSLLLGTREYTHNLSRVVQAMGNVIEIDNYATRFNLYNVNTILK